ncbi:MAG: Asp-tRNA(Asn)/Glu-tRNA(Gln) amidotransferase subunit GatA [Chloroflexi bacterium]|nr:Asp-tRNA(Asn)/Glu-tRNA(Gln) amidotransferase subunit GatA [Chloroflexota bacterium]
MVAQDLTRLSIIEAAGLVKQRKLSPVELVRAHLDRIERLNPKLNAFITVMGDSALREARKAEREVQQGKYRGPLHGIPVSLKDLYWTKGVRTTAGSKIMADFVPTEDCTVVSRFKKAGAVIVGKNHLHEFAIGGTGINPHYPTARNPWDLERITGGSSSGSGAAIASGMTLASMGSDTGGSIRIPAALCGVVGLKATYGRVSKYGVVTLSWSLDHAGPLTRTVADTAAVLRAIAGYDPKDPSTARVRVPDYLAALRGDLRGLRVGLPRDHFFNDVDPEVSQAVHRAVAVLGELGCSVQEVSLPSFRFSAATGTSIAMAEAIAFHEPWLRDRPQDYGADVRDRLEAAMVLTATQYVKAQQLRRVMQREMQAALAQVDVIVSPTCPGTAPLIKKPMVKIGDREQSAASVIGVLTRPCDYTGTPAVSVPCGFDSRGLPIGLQIMGRAWDEATVLKAAHAYEQATEWHQRWPSEPA